MRARFSSDTPNVKASLCNGWKFTVMQLDQAETIQHNADLGRWSQMCNASGTVWMCSPAPNRQLGKSGALEQQKIQVQFATDTPTLENTFVARLREIKGDSSEVNYPGFTPKNNRNAIGAKSQ